MIQNHPHSGTIREKENEKKKFKNDKRNLIQDLLVTTVIDFDIHLSTHFLTV